MSTEQFRGEVGVKLPDVDILWSVVMLLLNDTRENQILSFV